MNGQPKPNPECRWHEDCYALREGRCNLLTNNDFRKECPFYKVKGTERDSEKKDE